MPFCFGCGSMHWVPSWRIFSIEDPDADRVLRFTRNGPQKLVRPLEQDRLPYRGYGNNPGPYDEFATDPQTRLPKWAWIVNKPFRECFSDELLYLFGVERPSSGAATCERPGASAFPTLASVPTLLRPGRPYSARLRGPVKCWSAPVPSAAGVFLGPRT